MIYNWIFRESFKRGDFFLSSRLIFIIFTPDRNIYETWLHYFEMSILYCFFKIECENDAFSLSWITMLKNISFLGRLTNRTSIIAMDNVLPCQFFACIEKNATCAFSTFFFLFFQKKKKKSWNAVIFKLEMVDSYKWIGEKYSVEKEGVKNSIHPVN